MSTTLIIQKVLPAVFSLSYEKLPLLKLFIGNRCSNLTSPKFGYFTYLNILYKNSKYYFGVNTLKKYIKYGTIGIIIGLCNGLFGSGGGTVAVPCMEKFLDVEKKKAHATAIAIILPLTLISIFFYTKKGFFDFNLVWKVSIGGVLGGVLGAYILKKLKPHYIARIFGIFLIIAAIRTVFR